MSEKPTRLVAISDVFGVGKLSESEAAKRLVDAIVTGCGRIVGPWLLKREVKTQLELQRIAEESLGKSFDAKITLDDRSRVVLTTQRLTHQQNREAIAAKAVLELEAESIIDEATKGDIEPDWLSHFWQKAESVGDDEMQEIWARVLSGKAVGRSYSARTLDLLRTLSKDEAKLIEGLAAYKVAIGPDHPYWRTSIGLVNSIRLVLPGEKKEAPERIMVRGRAVVDAEQDKTQSDVGRLIGNPFANVFGPMGLYVESGFSHSFGLNWNNEPLPIQIGSRKFEIVGLKGGEGGKPEFFIFGEGIGFSQVGWEVFSLAKVPPDERFLAAINDQLALKGLSLREVATS